MKRELVDVRVRRAISHAIDRKGINEAENLGASRLNGNDRLAMLRFVGQPLDRPLGEAIAAAPPARQRALARCTVVTPRGRSLAVRMNPTDAGIEGKAKWICPPSRSVSASGLLLYGTCNNCTPAIC